MSESTPMKKPLAGINDEQVIERLFQSPIERRILDNGLTLLHRPDFASEVVSVQVWVKTGSIHEGALLGSGLSHYLEHLLFKGTARRMGKDISREVHALGGAINAYTTFDRTVYYIDGPAAAFAEMVDLLSDITVHSTLPEEEVERERDVILREIDMGLDDPDRELTQALFRTAFQRHPYREPVIGHRELFEKVSAEELCAYYKARYVPNNLVVSVVGAVHPREVADLVDATFGEVPRGRLAPVQLDTEPVQLGVRREDIYGDYNILRGGLAFKVPHLSHPDSPKLDALAHALGGGESSLLWERLRNQLKLVHFIDCRNWNPGSRGLFWISYGCDPEKGHQAESAIRELIAEIAEAGIDPAYVEKACRQALSAEINGRKTMSGQASRLGLGEVVIGDVYFGRRYLNRLQSLEPGDLQAAAASYLRDENLSVVSLGPRGIEQQSEAEAEPGRPGPFEQIEYASGARLLLQADGRLPKLHLRAVFRGGAFFENENERGISALLGELLTKDTQSRTAEEVSECIERLGGSFSAAAGNNTLSLAIEVLPDDMETAVELLTEALASPRFNSATFEVERDAQVAGLREEDDEILDYGFRLLRERFFGSHPFAVGPDGREADLRSLKLESIQAQYARLVRAGNLVLSVCGDFQREALVDALKPLLERKLPREPLEVVDTGFRYPEAPLVEKVPMEREQAVLLEAYPDVGLLDESFPVAEVLNELFSGMSSRLFERVREDLGLAYYVGSTRVIGLRGGLFAFYAGTHPRHQDTVFREIEAELSRVRSGQVTEEELVRCRTRLKAARPMGRQTPGARAMHAALNVTYGLPVDDDAKYARDLDAVSVSDLADFAQKHFDAKRRIRLIVGPPDELEG
ncbi:MAG: M16 family metallopeptidase [Opitutales bacterium]